MTATSPPSAGAANPRPPRAGTRWIITPRQRRQRLLAFFLLLAVLVGLVLWIRQPTAQPVDGYLPAHPTASAITVRVVVGPGDKVIRGSANERADRVTVSVLVRQARGTGPGMGIPIEVPIALGQPLGGRSVVDAHTGQQLREIRR